MPSVALAKEGHALRIKQILNPACRIFLRLGKPSVFSIDAAKRTRQTEAPDRYRQLPLPLFDLEFEKPNNGFILQTLAK